MAANPPLALIVGCSGKSLTAEERALFRDQNPLGFILFAHNVETPDQVRALVESLRDTVGRADAPVLIDQEGGRVRRLKPPHWFDAPSAATLSHAKDPERACWLSARLIADDLQSLGITVDCAPVLDVPQPGADPIIGDRAFGTTPETISRLGRAVMEGLLAGGVLPVIKHIPGHGRAEADSHKELPIVGADRATLEAIDIPPFQALADAPLAMTAHVVYEAYDKTAPATTSPTVINQVIRGLCGFEGLLISDDLAMEALEGDLSERARAVLLGGCDLVLYCNTEFKGLDTVRAVAEACQPMTALALERHERAERARRAGLQAGADWDREQGLADLNSLLGR
ncbi:MAG: beta-N-acetylhexosaminidase [Magnetovibrionaceae bacterium]